MLGCDNLGMLCQPRKRFVTAVLCAELRLMLCAQCQTVAMANALKHDATSTGWLSRVQAPLHAAAGDASQPDVHARTCPRT